jgi:putative transposase
LFYTRDFCRPTCGARKRLVFKLVEAAPESSRRLDGHNQLPKLIVGVKFADGVEVTAKPDRRQPTTTAA